MASTKHRLCAVVASALIVFTAACGSETDLAERQSAVAAAGAQVMPFDLDRTTHIFTDADTGGIQDVVADDPTDDATIEQIRLHLAEEATKFSSGDFSDPEAIHGPTMPGLATLKARYDEIEVELTETTSGATLRYTARDPELVSAIHDWFNAQTQDHGTHAEGSS